MPSGREASCGCAKGSAPGREAHAPVRCRLHLNNRHHSSPNPAPRRTQQRTAVVLRLCAALPRDDVLPRQLVAPHAPQRVEALLQARRVKHYDIHLAQLQQQPVVAQQRRGRRGRAGRGGRRRAERAERVDAAAGGAGRVRAYRAHAAVAAAVAARGAARRRRAAGPPPRGPRGGARGGCGGGRGAGRSGRGGCRTHRQQRQRSAALRRAIGGSSRAARAGMPRGAPSWAESN